MAIQRFLIAPFITGTQTNVRPWLVPDEAWAAMFNCHINNGRIERRLGSAPMNNAVAGNVECINILSDMVYELKTPIKQYTERILKK